MANDRNQQQGGFSQWSQDAEREHPQQEQQQGGGSKRPAGRLALFVVVFDVRSAQRTLVVQPLAFQ